MRCVVLTSVSLVAALLLLALPSGELSPRHCCAGGRWQRSETENNTVSSKSSESKMTSVEWATAPSAQKDLHVPPLQELADVLSRGLPENFELASAEVAPCPDLTRPPYNLAASGLCGNAELVELGGPPYLMPLVRRDKVYDLGALLRHLGRDPALLAGAGAGPWPHVGVNCEGIVNLSVRGGVVEQGTRIVTVEGGGATYRVRRLPANETRSALLGNYLLSDGAPGQVLKVTAEKRTGPANFITAIREALQKHYGDRVVGLGGMFVLREGRARFHVMPDFSATPMTSEEDLNRWLKFYEMRSPLTHVGTLVTGDMGLDLRLQHFHGWGEHGDGGHYHYDTTPDAARYEGYFVPAARVLRLDAPVETHTMGRD
ncbi:Ester hydrolase C11orf54 [Eumeta japonica]|uniref:Ester hydrolase C11orf54 n=1 Tax=Eumeta variegata TaxID=151549 RepID=A0A4C1V1V1_EUMVA|nr:Ester hydrolase C11orf54 [Eumeta japonica]